MITIPLIEAGLKILDKIIPDPEAREKAKLELMKQQQEGAFKELELQSKGDTEQSEVNKVEASSQNLFVSGWRPFIGWVCGGSFAWSYFLMPMLTWILIACGHSEIVLPKLDTGELMSVTLGMLGLGIMRSHDKLKGIA